MEEIFAEAQQLRLFRPLDIQFARILANYTQPALMLASACLSADTSNVCLPLSLITPEHLFDGCFPTLARKAWRRAGSPSTEEWQQLLLASSAVSDGSRPTPLVLDNQRLYLQRMWLYECAIAQFFTQSRLQYIGDEAKIASTLKYYFPRDRNEINWQKVAVAIAITQPIALICGGPGTGKTSIIAKLLAILLQTNDNARLRIMLAAPTGKAAVRLSESIEITLQHLILNEDIKQRLPREAITLHRLLGAKTNSQQLQYHRNNLLHVDILIIDEASMIDLSMMANIIAALPQQARVIFLGDQHQLPSVGAGTVLGDICQVAVSNSYSPKRRKELSQLTGYVLPEGNSSGIADNLCILHKNYRFYEGSNISKLANMIKDGNVNKALALLNSNTMKKDINYITLRKTIEYQKMITDCVRGYREYLLQVHSNETPNTILATFNQFRVLCALREGPFGVTGLNNYIEQALILAKLLIPKSNTSYNYAGRPIIITRNAPELGLYNGDTGILLADKEQMIMRVYFFMPNGNIKAIPLNRLPEHETSFAMTIHKSQGSEFLHTALVLPNYVLPVLTRELLYTAITRTRVRLLIYATDEVLCHTIATKTQRRSGLIERLYKVV